MTLPRITKFKLPRAELVARDDVRAHITQLWLDGHSQREIARAFGYTKSPPISMLIAHFITKWMPDKGVQWHSGFYPAAQGDERKPVAHQALQQRRRNLGKPASNIVRLRG